MVGNDQEVVMASKLMKLAIAAVLTFGMSVALPQSGSAASKRPHHSTKVQVKKPAEQYLRSAAPSDPEHAQR